MEASDLQSSKKSCCKNFLLPSYIDFLFRISFMNTWLSQSLFFQVMYVLRDKVTLPKNYFTFISCHNLTKRCHCSYVRPVSFMFASLTIFIKLENLFLQMNTMNALKLWMFKIIHSIDDQKMTLLNSQKLILDQFYKWIFRNKKNELISKPAPFLDCLIVQLIFDKYELR